MSYDCTDYTGLPARKEQKINYWSDSSADVRPETQTVRMRLEGKSIKFSGMFPIIKSYIQEDMLQPSGRFEIGVGNLAEKKSAKSKRRKKKNGDT